MTACTCKAGTLVRGLLIAAKSGDGLFDNDADDDEEEIGSLTGVSGEGIDSDRRGAVGCIGVCGVDTPPPPAPPAAAIFALTCAAIFAGLCKSASHPPVVHKFILHSVQRTEAVCSSHTSQSGAGVDAVGSDDAGGGWSGEEEEEMVFVVVRGEVCDDTT